MNTDYDLSTASMLQLLVAVILPLFVALVTKWSTSSQVKALLLLFFTVAASSVTTVIQSLNDTVSGFDWKHWALNFAIAYVLAVVSHYGLWKNTAIQPAAQKLLVKDPVDGVYREDYTPPGDSAHSNMR